MYRSLTGAAQASPALSTNNPAAGRRNLAPVLVPNVGSTWVSRDQGATNQSNGTDTQMHTLKKHTAIGAGTGFWVHFTNSYNFGGTPTDNTDSITVRCAFSIGGIFYRVWFGDGTTRDATIEPGGGAWGFCGGHYESGDTLFSRTKVSVASAGMKWPIGLGEAMNGTDEGAVGTTSSTDLTTSGTITANSNAGYFPAAILGLAQPTSQSILAVGDSILAGKGDSSVAGLGAGWFIRAAASIPHLRAMPFSGETAGQWLAANGSQTQIHTFSRGHFTAGLCEYGINDITGGQTLVNVQARLSEIWRQMDALGMRVYQTTLPPVTTSTDSWATTANQTVTATNGIRTQVNDWIRTVPAPLAGYVEVADAAETSRNSGIWNALYTSDGTHPNGVGHLALSTAVNLSLLT
jgi:lysophospholipase L1-like esterase